VSTVVDLEVSSLDHSNSNPHLDWTQQRIVSEIPLDGLDNTQAQLIQQMLLSRSRVLSRGDSDIGMAAVTRHRIELHDETPIRQKPRRFPDPIVEAVEQQCHELEALDIIERSKSPWSSPIVPIRKKDGSIRLCIDYRKLNSVTKADRFPMPNLNGLVYSLHGMQYFSTLDLVRGYYQIPLEESSKELTAFSTTKNHYQFKRLSFGLKNAPAAFQREMQEILRAFPSRQVIVYIDDILIMSRSFEEHLELIDRVLGTFENYGIKIKPSKCRFFKRSVPFLGHVVGSSGLQKAPEYVDQVTNFPKPSTVSQLRQFLGLVNFQRKFIPNCSVIAQPLSCLTGGPKKKQITWTDAMDSAFNKLKELMKQDLMLSYPDYSPNASKLQLYVDASGYGAGACLMQCQDGEQRVIAHNSMSFNHAQRRYSTIDRELAAIRWGIKSFRPFLYGIPFILYTDHRPLTYMKNMAGENSRINRTLHELEEFDMEIRYIKGESNTAADTLSRMVHLNQDHHAEEVDPGYLPQGLKILQYAEGGGDSMVQSLFLVLQHHQSQMDPNIPLPGDRDELRVLLVEELISHPEKYHFSLSKHKRQQLMLSQKQGHLLGEEILVVFYGIFGLEVWVHCGMEKPIIHTLAAFSTTSSTRRIHLQLLSGMHYNPVVEDQMYQSPNQVKSNFLLPVRSDSGDFDDSDLEVDDGVLLANFQWLQVSCSCARFVRSTTTVQLNGTTYCALLDTGAQVSLIREDVWLALPTSIKETSRIITEEPVRLHGVGGGSASVVEIVSLPIGLVGLASGRSFPFAVVRQDSLPFCFLLGANFIKVHDLSVDFQRKSFKFTVDGVTLVYPLGSESRNRQDVQFCFEHIVCPADAHDVFPLYLDIDDMGALQVRNHAIRLLRRMVTDEVDTHQWKQRCLQQFKRYSDKLKVTNDLLWFSRDRLSVPVITYNFLVEVVITVHWNMSHIGRHKLIEIVSKHFWHPGLDAVARDVCACCITCQTCKIAHQTVAPPTLKIMTSCPFELVSVDLIDFPRTARGFVTMLMAVDQFSKWLVAVPLKDKKGETVAHALEHRVLPILPRCPDRVLSDNGPEFRSAKFSSTLSKYGITHSRSTPYKPSSNGGVERVNRTIAEVLRSSIGHSSSWDLELARAVMIYNTTVHRELKMSPSECLLRIPHDITSQPLIPLETKQQWTEGHPSFVSFRQGQLVLMKIHRTGNLTIDKLKPKYEGPFRITKVQDNGVTYVIEHTINGNRYTKSVHHKHIKKFNVPPKYLLGHPCYIKFHPSRCAPTVTLESNRGLDSDDCLPIVFEFSGDSRSDSDLASDVPAELVPADPPAPQIASNRTSYVKPVKLKHKRRGHVGREKRLNTLVECLELLPCSEQVVFSEYLFPYRHSTPVRRDIYPFPDGNLSSIAPQKSFIDTMDGMGKEVNSVQELEDRASTCVDVFERHINTLGGEGSNIDNLDVADQPVEAPAVETPVADPDNLEFSGFEMVSGGNFSGFQSVPLSDLPIGKTSTPQNRLQELRNIIAEARLSIEQSRRSHATISARGGLLQATTSSLSHSPAVAGSLWTPVRQTRSRGPAVLLPNVQSFTIERKRKGA
jgi:hypothetical protein